jgi:Rhodanese-related sulfurtransferase
MIYRDRWYYIWVIFIFLVILPVTVYAQANTAKLKKHDPTLLIGVDSILQKKSENKDMVIIDVRTPDQFEKIRIPSSINMPLFSVKTKQYLKSKLLILVNEGYNYSQLESECMKLRNGGFKAYILHGGLYYWVQNGAPLEGVISSKKSLNKISPPVFLTEKDYSNWIIVDVSSAEKINEPLSGQFIFVPYTGNSDKFSSSLEKSLEKIKTDEFSLIMICNEKGEDYDKIEAILEKSKTNRIFFLEGGKEGLKKAMAKANEQINATTNQSGACK